MRIILVDEGDNEVGTKIVPHGSQTNLSEVIYRAASVLLKNSQGDLLITQRSFDKFQSPGLWESPGGFVEVGETYESTAIAEIAEELNHSLTQAELILGPKILVKRNDPVRQHFSQHFYAHCDKEIAEFTLQKNEVESARWISPSDLSNELKQYPENFVDIALEVIEQSI